MFVGKLSGPLDFLLENWDNIESTSHGSVAPRKKVDCGDISSMWQGFGYTLWRHNRTNKEFDLWPFDLDLDLWPWPWPLTFDLDLELEKKKNNFLKLTLKKKINFWKNNFWKKN